MQIRPFTIHIEDDQIADLRQRLTSTRFPRSPEPESWASGTSLSFMHRLVDHWANAFDWRAQESRLNALPQFMAEVDGLAIHFIHQRGNGPAPLPLILTHGWPGSFVEMERVIPLLTDPGAHGGDPADAFDVVVPSLPGFGFSQAPEAESFGSYEIAGLWRKLMHGLGYHRFAAQGGDIGAGVSTWLSYRFPEHLIGLHLNYIPGSYQPPLGPDQPPITADEQAYLDRAKSWLDTEGAYAHMQGTKPGTLAFALSDSPAGLAAWIVEKFRTWSDCDGDVERVFSFDELLTNISIYWFTANVQSTLALYKANRARPLRFAAGERIDPPFGFAHFPKELPTPPRSWAERCYNVTRWTTLPKGGHFAALEQPQLLAAEIRAFFRGLR